MEHSLRMKLKPNSLREAPAVCVSPSFPLQRQFLCALPRSTVFSWHRARASDIGAGRMSGQQTADLFPVPPLLYFVFCSVTLPLLLSRINPPLLFHSCVTVRGFFPTSPIHLSVAGIIFTRRSRCEVAHGGREGSRAWPLDGPVPPMLA